MTEHQPIMRYLARKHGLYPKTEQERAIAEQTESFLLDVSTRRLTLWKYLFHFSLKFSNFD